MKVHGVFILLFGAITLLVLSNTYRERNAIIAAFLPAKLASCPRGLESQATDTTGVSRSKCMKTFMDKTTTKDAVYLNDEATITPAEVPTVGHLRTDEEVKIPAKVPSVGHLRTDEEVQSVIHLRSDEEVEVPAKVPSVGHLRTDDDRDGRVIDSIRLLGERHSGTTWMTSHLEKCFGHKLTVEPKLSRWKHWFQTNDPTIRNALVVAQFRNVYDWTNAMIQVPHHAPNHFNRNNRTSLHWLTFVQKPWEMPREWAPRDLETIQQGKEENVHCQVSYSFHEVIPCHRHDRVALRYRYGGPLYELNHNKSGTPYNSILDLRHDKILNLVQDVPTFDGVTHYIQVTYEDMVQKGTAKLIAEIENVTGVRARCKPSPSQRLKKPKYDEKFINYLDQHVDWSVEKLIGYEKKK